MNSVMAPLLAELGTPSNTFMQSQNWIESVLYLADGSTTSPLTILNTTLAPDSHDTFYATSTFVSEEEPMVPAAADALMQYFYGPGATSPVEWFIILYVSPPPRTAVLFQALELSSPSVIAQRPVRRRKLCGNERPCGLQRV